MRSGIIAALLLITGVLACGQMGQNSSDLLSTTSYTEGTDTLSAMIPYPVSVKGYIKFASAFRWNHTGPTGGYWSENNVDDYIFRPVFSDVAAYKLEIYNRFGYLVFESEDLHRGWDGYLKNGALASQGVYIWKASGKFTDGIEFRKAGDVTFIY